MRALLFFVLVLSGMAAATGETDFHRCLHADGTLELRDRSCPAGSRAVQRALAGEAGGTFSTIPESRPPAALLERAEESIRRAREPRRTESRAADGGGNELRCAEYEKRVDAIDRRLRKGYTASQGNRLRAERRRIRRLLADACR